MDAIVHPCKKFKRKCSQCQNMSSVMAQPNLVKLVLSCLSAKELLSAPVIVSKQWNEVTRFLLTKRGNFSLLLHSDVPEQLHSFLPAACSFLHNSYCLPKKMMVFTSRKLQISVSSYVREKSKRLCYQEVSKDSSHKMMARFLQRECIPRTCELYTVAAHDVLGFYGTLSPSVATLGKLVILNVGLIDFFTASFVF